MRILETGVEVVVSSSIGAPFALRILVLILNVPHINNRQQAVENQSIICQMTTDPSSWTTAAASFFFPTLRALD
jgi:hypothetical protein